jgi:hypothetical protein
LAIKLLQMNRHLVIALVILLLPASAQAARTAELCIDDWSMAVPVVKEEGLATVTTVAKLARDRFKGTIVKVTLCQCDGRYVYRILMRGTDNLPAGAMMAPRPVRDRAGQTRHSICESQAPRAHTRCRR